MKDVSRRMFAIQTSGDVSEAGEGLKTGESELQAKLGGFHLGFAVGQTCLGSCQIEDHQSSAVISDKAEDGR